MSEPVLLGVGANLDSSAGPPAATILESIKILSRSDLQVLAVSRLYQTPAFPPGSGSDYVNAAMVCSTNLDAPEILKVLHDIEAHFGRERQHRWGARTLDIDLLGVGAQVLPDRTTHDYWRDLSLEEQKQHPPQTLILPHPRMHERGFVLVPLAESAAAWQHPILKLSAAEMLANLPESDVADIRPI
ncbi:MAG: 2-amino-4-hydroxy-6-hydroxymethyldihydropteridine diphosphokinase [Paracoccaceae bacterium]